MLFCGGSAGRWSPGSHRRGAQRATLYCEETAGHELAGRRQIGL